MKFWMSLEIELVNEGGIWSGEVERRIKKWGV